MSLSYVNLSSDVYFVCVNHALSTEREEIVGLLVGEVDEKRVAHVSAVVILRRSDKRKDRVEISPEQLSNASTEAERLSCILKRPIRIIGWYHSHPKLTVWPSPIDVNTQDSYQLMDDGFIGMIFSVFNEDPSKKGGRIQMTCFQSQTVIEDGNVEKKRLDVPVHLVPANHISNVCMKALIQLPRFLCQEEQLAYQITSQMDLDCLTRLHNSSVYLRSMGQIAEVICGPLIKMLEERIITNEIKRKKLQNKKKEITMVFEQIQKENARSGASRDADNFKTDSELDTHSVIDSVALDDILLGNIPKSSVDSLCEESESSESPVMHCSADELISSTESSDVNECFQANMPSTSKANMPPTSKANMPSTSKANMPSTSKANMPSTSKANMPSTSKANMPSTSKANMSSSSKANMSSSSKANMPSTSKANMPSTSKANTPSTSKADTPSTSKASTPSTSKANTPSTSKANMPSTSKDCSSLPSNQAVNILSATSTAEKDSVQLDSPPDSPK